MKHIITEKKLDQILRAIEVKRFSLDEEETLKRRILSVYYALRR